MLKSLTFAAKPQMKEKKTVYKQKHGSEKAFNDTGVNRSVKSLHGGSIEITLTVPLISF